MPKLIDIPEGTDVVDVRKKMNNCFQQHETVRSQINVSYVENPRQVFAIHIQFRNYLLEILLIMEKFCMFHY